MAKRYTIAISVITTGARKSAKNIRELEGAGAQVAKSFDLAKTAAIGFGAILSSSLIQSVARTGMEFETLKARLKTAEGSLDGAGKKFKQLQDFTRETPFTIQQVTDSYIKLKNLGIDPTAARMEAFGNIASAQGKSMQQFAEAVADAATNEFERLKEFGIKAKQETDSVTFTIGDTSKTVRKESDAIVGYLEEIGRVRFAGAMADQMETTQAAVTNLRGSLDELADAVWSGGLGSSVNEFVRGLTKAVTYITDTWKNLEILEKRYLSTAKALQSVVAEFIGAEGAAAQLRKEAVELELEFRKLVLALDDTEESGEKAGKALDDVDTSLKNVGNSAADAEAELRRAVDRLVDAAKTDVERAAEDFEEAGRIMGIAIAEGMVDEETRKKVMEHFGLLASEARAAAGEFDATATGADPGKGTDEILRNTERIGREWDDIAFTVADMIRDLSDGTADWIDYLNYAVELWGQIAQASQSGGGGGGAGGGGASAGDTASSGFSQYASSSGYGGVTAAIAIYTAVYEAVDAMIERDKAKIYGLPITTGGVGLSAYGGQAIASNGQGTLETAEISEGLRRGFESILDVIGGFVTDIDEFGIQIQASGKKFRAIVGDQIIGSFDTMQQAIEQATKYALKTATFEGIGDNMRAALKNSWAQTMEGFLEHLELGRWIDELGMSDLEVQISNMSRVFLRAAEDARRLGMDVGAVSEGFLGEMQSIRDRILGIHKSEYEQRLDDADAYNRQIQERIAQLQRYLAELQAGSLGPLGGSGSAAGGATGGPGAPNGPDGAAGALDRFAASVANVGMVATTVANEAVDPAVQAIIDEIAELQKLMIDPADVKKGGGGGGSGRRDAIKRLWEDFDRIANAANGPVSAGIQAVNDNFDRLEDEARRLRQPLADIVALREREVEALREQARNEFIDNYVNFIEDFGEIEQAMIDFGKQADAVRAQIDDLLEAGVINAEQAAALLAEVQNAQNGKIGAFARSFANDTLVQLYDYLGDEKASAELRWELAKAEMEMRLAQLEIAKQQGHLSADTMAHIREVWGDVLSAGNPFDNEEDPPVGGGGTVGGGSGSGNLKGDDLQRMLDRLKNSTFSTIEELIAAWTQFTEDTGGYLYGSFLAEAESVFAEMVDAMEDVLIQPIRDLRDEILADELGPLSARERFERMQAEYLDVAARAQGGDLDAIQQYEEVARAFREVYQGFHGNAAAGFLDAQILSMIQQLEGLDLSGSLNYPGGSPTVTAQLGPGGPVSASTMMLAETIDMRGGETVSELRTLNDRMERIERHMADGVLGMNRWRRAG